MNWNKWIRQSHRWLSIVFTVVVIANIVALIRQIDAQWLGFLALLPLLPLMFTGLYLFALPYLAKRRGAQGVGASSTIDG